MQKKGKEENISRVKLLRVWHYLQANEMADLAGITYRAYQKFEKDEPSLQIDRLLIWADTFGVTLDWLSGRLEAKYSEDAMSYCEEKVEAKLKALAAKHEFDVPSRYKNKNTRRSSYDLETRANIVSYVNLIEYFSKQDTDRSHFLMKEELMKLQDNLTRTK